MKRSFLVLLAAALSFGARAQDPSVQETARTFLRSGDFDNAVLVLTRALQQDPKNYGLQKDLTMALFYKRDYTKALDIIPMMLDHKEVDPSAFQIAGNIYRALERAKDADKLYRKALDKFPKSGPLYSEYGELLWARKDFDAIRQWEKGIKADPAYAGNYYNAALYYYHTKDKVWALVYGEIFVNMESLSERATAMRGLLLSAYKEKLFADADIMKDQPKGSSEFARAFLESMGKQSSLVNAGVNADVLTMVRTRFILDWSRNYAQKFPFKLFEFQQQLLREGLFEAYNQWLFGTGDNLPAFDTWARNHSAEYEKFTNFQKGRVFRMPPGQYYQ
ncbi:tetratricopeptide repeat protein [Flaviaesturariibacter amylovorans]|uniref:Tetratricopeptide repeat protein n=1 Tax=Flaviaesturariibacter amylovorans TaxID=1084520 RepID=A0ABP8G481_9BACT